MSSKESLDRLYISNFPRGTTKEQIHDLCSRFGKVVSVDIIPQRRFGFVTFASNEEATLAVYGIKQQGFRGHPLGVDWAKMKKEDERPQRGGRGGDAGRGGGGDEGVVPVENVVTPPSPAENGKEAYIPGSEVVPTPKKKQSKTNNGSTPKQPKQPPPPQVKSTSAPPQPPPTPTSLNDAEPIKIYTEVNPDLEVTIRDPVTGDLKYKFRVQALPHLQQFLIDEGAPDVDNLFLASLPKKEKNKVTYQGIEVFHVYKDSLGMEMLESRGNKQQREKNIRDLKKNPGYRIPSARVPLSENEIPTSELQNILTQKGYKRVYLNTSSSIGQYAPLHPSWVPEKGQYAYLKGATVVVFTGDHVLNTCELINTNNNTYKDLFPFITQFDACVFNVKKQAFITPEQI